MVFLEHALTSQGNALLSAGANCRIASNGQGSGRFSGQQLISPVALETTCRLATKVTSPQLSSRSRWSACFGDPSPNRGDIDDNRVVSDRQARPLPCTSS
jgi:hypothetical protein